MSDLKITVDHLKNYLGTSLRVVESEYITRELIGIHNDQPILNDYGYTLIKNIQPICYRLSDIDKEIEHNGERFVPHEKILQEIISRDGSCKDGDGYFGWSCSTGGDDYQDYWAAINDNFQIEFYTGHPDEGGYMTGQEALHWSYVQKLFEWHFWPYGEEYFEQGLVIDKRKEAGRG